MVNNSETFDKNNLVENKNNSIENYIIFPEIIETSNLNNNKLEIENSENKTKNLDKKDNIIDIEHSEIKKMAP